MKSYLYHNRPSDVRRGFTVVEVLVAITIIAILAAILTPVVGSALRRANEFAIESEMSQLDLAIEHFKSDNGFYPPSFANFNSGADILPYLNRIAPNHAENAARLDAWWTQVGQHIKQEYTNTGLSTGADMVFWLSGIAKNRQYPLTYGPDNAPIGLAAHSNGIGIVDNDNTERNVYFTFKADRLRNPITPNGQNAPTLLVANYMQARGKESQYIYIDSGSYPGSTAYSPNPGSGTFFNQGSFQLVAAGLDGNFGAVWAGGTLPGAAIDSNGDVVSPNCGLRGMDNIVNFVGEGVGKLETKALGID